MLCLKNWEKNLCVELFHSLRSILSLPLYFLHSLSTVTPRAITLDSIHTIKVQNKNIPSQLSKDQLDHTPRPIEETITDTLKFFKDVGVIS